jgi:hypothetical protein
MKPSNRLERVTALPPFRCSDHSMENGGAPVKSNEAVTPTSIALLDQHWGMH